MLRSAGQSAAERCRPEIVVLDFDGTLTDADAHTPAFLAASAAELARRLGRDDLSLQPEWRRAYDAIRALPPDAAWVIDGRGMCPAAADPYVIANGVSKRLLSEWHPEWAHAAVDRMVIEVHHAAYLRALPSFRPEACRLIDGLTAAGLRVAVVTNSHTQTVERLLGTLACRGREGVMVVGDAGKFSICGAAEPDAGFAALPETVEWPGVGRPIHVRKGKYFDALRRAWREAGPGSTLVVGDSLELDLAMPAALGAHVHLVIRAGTPPHEIRLAGMLARGESSAGLIAVLDRIGVGAARG